MIILGSHRREFELSSGQFHCPNCDALRPYKRKRAGKYFTLYFIPLFQLENLGEYVVCQICQQTYKPEVLTRTPLSSAERFLRALHSELGTGLPIHMLEQKMIANGLPPGAANQIVAAATPGAQVKCSKCGFSYLGTLKFCANCGNNRAA